MNKLHRHIYIILKEQSVNESLEKLGEISPALTKSVSRNLPVVGQFTFSQVNKKRPLLELWHIKRRLNKKSILEADKYVLYMRRIL